MDSPLAMFRFGATVVMSAITFVVLLMTLVTGSTDLLRLAGLLWLFYGIILGIAALLDQSLDGLPSWLGSVGLTGAAGGWSAIESLIVRGQYEAAIDALMERAREPGLRVEATVRHARLLERDLNQPDAAAALLSGLPRAELSAGDDRRVGLILAELYERKLGDRGRAAVELRRLTDREQSPGQREALLRRLEQVKREQAADQAVQ